MSKIEELQQTILSIKQGEMDEDLAVMFDTLLMLGRTKEQLREKAIKYIEEVLIREEAVAMQQKKLGFFTRMKALNQARENGFPCVHPGPTSIIYDTNRADLWEDWVSISIGIDQAREKCGINEPDPMLGR